MITLYCDGAFEPPGIVGVGTWAEESGVTLFEIGQQRPDIPRMMASCNVAELEAIATGLEKLSEMGRVGDPIVVKSDSQLAINLLNGSWRARNAEVYGWALEHVRKLLPRFKSLSFVWIPRESNEAADYLSKRHLKVVLYRKRQKRDKGFGKRLSQVLAYEHKNRHLKSIVREEF